MKRKCRFIWVIWFLYLKHITLIKEVHILVQKNDKTEPIWTNGEMSVIKTALIVVILENKGNIALQILPNAYYFVAEMFKINKDELCVRWVCKFH